ncbi:MAG: hypothetical protein WC866_03685 [Patescibacteria group bacterium]
MKKRHVLLVTFLAPIILMHVFRAVFGFMGLFVGLAVSAGLVTLLWRWRAATCRVRVLEILDTSTEGVSGRELGRVVHLTAPHVFLENLVESGHLEQVWRQEYAQHPSGGQLRVDICRYTLTPKGRDELERHRGKTLPQAKTV